MLYCFSDFCRFVCFVVACDLCFFFFFFQAEDGIRDWSVTGVQTCALPISARWLRGTSLRLRRVMRWSPGDLDSVSKGEGEAPAEPGALPARQEPRPPENATVSCVHRSEERRVGKGWRCRWAAGHWKEKNLR